MLQSSSWDFGSAVTATNSFDWKGKQEREWEVRLCPPGAPHALFQSVFSQLEVHTYIFKKKQLCSVINCQQSGLWKAG